MSLEYDNPYQSPSYQEEPPAQEPPTEPLRNRLGEAGACLAGYGLLLLVPGVVTGSWIAGLATVPGLVMSLASLQRSPRTFSWCGIVMGILGPFFILMSLFLR